MPGSRMVVLLMFVQIGNPVPNSLDRLLDAVDMAKAEATLQRVETKLLQDIENFNNYHATSNWQSDDNHGCSELAHEVVETHFAVFNIRLRLALCGICRRKRTGERATESFYCSFSCDWKGLRQDHYSHVVHAVDDCCDAGKPYVSPLFNKWET